MKLDELLINCKSRIEIKRGWSEDKKIYIEDFKNNKFLLRLMPILSYEDKIIEYNRIRLFNELDIPMSKALDFGKYDDEYCYMLLSYVEGEDLRYKILSYSDREQYEIGFLAGEYNRKINDIEIDEDYVLRDSLNYHDKKLSVYRESTINVDDDMGVLSYIEENIYKLDNLKPVYRHGDYHIGNMVIDEEDSLGIIDFNRQRIGNYYEEFVKNQNFNREISVAFAIGMIDGYFKGQEVDEDFWDLLSIYCAIYSLTSLNWAEKFGKLELEGMKKRYYESYDDYDGYSIKIPRWYSENKNRYKS